MTDKEQKWTLELSEAENWLQAHQELNADAMITDPPYSSGGIHKGDRSKSLKSKYVSGQRQYVDFSGDNRDQRCWMYWCERWLALAKRVVKDGGYLLCFVDWRQLPALTDALQNAGWLWRGIVVWDKGRGARAPHKGYFRHQAEFIVWASNGSLPPSEHGGPWDGVFQHKVYQSDKHHMTGKPTELMRELVRIVPESGLVIDPFAGSGTTGVASVLEGRRFMGTELHQSYYEVATKRIEAAERGIVIRSDEAEANEPRLFM